MPQTADAYLESALKKAGYSARCRVLSFRGKNTAHVIVSGAHPSALRVLQVTEAALVAATEQHTGIHLDTVLWTYRGADIPAQAQAGSGSLVNLARALAGSPPYSGRVADQEFLLSEIFRDDEASGACAVSEAALDKIEQEIKADLAKS